MEMTNIAKEHKRLMVSKNTNALQVEWLGGKYAKPEVGISSARS